MKPSVRVLVVEDSPTQAASIAAALGAGGLDVVGIAATVGEAIAATERDAPDVVTMDLDVPGGGGQEAIRRIMQRTPTPIVVLSRLVGPAGSPEAIDALAAGAIDALPKPNRWTEEEMGRLQRAVRLASGVAVVRRRGPRPPRPPRPGARPDEMVVGIGASTGGPAALAEVFRGLGSVDAPVLVVQHIEPRFVDSLAQWLDRVSPMPVTVASDGERAVPGRVYVGPGGVHLRLAADGRLRLAAAPATLHRPSVDQLFASLAEVGGPRTAAALLTGMGKDGAEGLLAIRQAGGVTIAQDEETAVVFGMPQAAERLGAAERTLPLEAIGPALRRAVARTPG